MQQQLSDVDDEVPVLPPSDVIVSICFADSSP